ncbi:MAG TPA: substrate-binding domain-containing protein [Anaerolineales bacterium]|nr:substrate-binding domain-containing protein [Anaerolineales bacterium]
MARTALILSLSIVLSGCGQLPPGARGTATIPVPTPFPEIATTPSFQAWTTNRILAFREQKGSAAQRSYIGLGLQILAPAATLPAVEAGEFELVVSAQEPPADWFATPLGWEPIVFAVHSGNPVHDLSLVQLASIFRGQASNWSLFDGPDLGITPIIPLRGDELREALAGVLLGNSRYSTQALLGPSPEATLALVGQTPGAIGILPLSAVVEGVLVLQVGGLAPAVGDERYPLQVEVLGFAPQEPSGVVREWLAWLQAEGS